ncbi:metal ABC transporter solute-binding protein, Zn/Mn family [Sporosarcina sp. JAI121]|uniref:metal ABC transporter solute-binding protein, Zn/Mn family n=1 Tax=Sporosarcina sp. JAI121 TaxID=2723064 RepID=UPI0015CCBABA|nr:zinc ABC transporter substrate-binding protein [Sporosarcina sp. JAI121]NYF25523.1 zinc transport system substrate-binding protein [Sporosarcina sp. JAI121]
MNKRFLIIFSAIIIMLLSACNNNEVPQKKAETGTDNEKLSVYTTVYPLQYFTERIGGDQVNVKSIYPAGSDEHTFDPTQKDMMALADSDLFFYVGLGLEGFVDNAKKTLKNEHVKMVATAEDIPEEMLEEGHDDHEGHDSDEGHEGHNHGSLDPHVWISPVLSAELATSIKEELIEAKPEMKDEFEKNFKQLLVEIAELDGKFQEMAANAPSKTFFVSHASFGYIANAYGLKQVAIAGLNSQSEPSQKQLAIIVKEAKEQDVHYVLFEQNVSSKLTEVVRKEIGAESLMLHNLGVLTVEDVKNNETYFSLMERNIETLKKALSGK